MSSNGCKTVKQIQPHFLAASNLRCEHCLLCSFQHVSTSVVARSLCYYMYVLVAVLIAANNLELLTLVPEERCFKACPHCKLDRMYVQRELFEPVQSGSVQFDRIRTGFFSIRTNANPENEIRAWPCLVHVTLTTLTKKMDPVAIMLILFLLYWRHCKTN